MLEGRALARPSPERARFVFCAALLNFEDVYGVADMRR
jgi:hypothetical protein